MRSNANNFLYLNTDINDVISSQIKVQCISETNYSSGGTN